MCPFWRRRYGRCWKASRSAARAGAASWAGAGGDGRRVGVRARCRRVRLLAGAARRTGRHPLGRGGTRQRIRRRRLRLPAGSSSDRGYIGRTCAPTFNRASAAQPSNERRCLHGSVDLSSASDGGRAGRRCVQRNRAGEVRDYGAAGARCCGRCAGRRRQLPGQGSEQLLLWHPHAVDPIE